MYQLNSPRSRGITLLEVVIALIVIAVLASLSIPAVSVGLVKDGMTRALNNMRQLQLATAQMSVDHEADGNPVRWTCSNNTPLTLDQWKSALLDGYLSEADLKKMLSVKVDRPIFGNKIITNAFHVFAVSGSDAEATVLFATKNWHGPSGGEISGEPYGKKGFAVMRKGGDAMILQARYSTNLSLIGGGGILDFLPLK